MKPNRKLLDLADLVAEAQPVARTLERRVARAAPELAAEAHDVRVRLEGIGIQLDYVLWRNARKNSPKLDRAA